VQASSAQPRNVERPVADTEPHGRPRACEACRSRKIKCSGAPNSPGKTSCASCHRYRRACVFREGPPPKRRKRVDVRVRELERQINRLSAQLMRPALNLQRLRDDPEAAETLRPAAKVDYAAEIVSNDAAPDAPVDSDPARSPERIASRRTRRRPHQRSDGGCRQCKARRLKVSCSRITTPSY
jgi:hypothetical protein